MLRHLRMFIEFCSAAAAAAEIRHFPPGRIETFDKKFSGKKTF
jgi:hypothetical protein